MARTLEMFGRVDVWFANAGRSGTGEPIVEITPEG
jgi:hypothetical protein